MSWVFIIFLWVWCMELSDKNRYLESRVAELEHAVSRLKRGKK